MPGWHVWCGSLVENPGGGFSLFYSCWPVSQGHEGWVTHSQIWRAEGPAPWGPFSGSQPVLVPDGNTTWDADNFHNVTVKEFNGRYYLYYTGNNGNGDWWIHRNNQRIGLAVADSPSGPWSRSPAPLLDISSSSWDSLCIANPSVVQTPGGGFIMIYKGVTAGDLPYGSKVLHGMAFADRPDGPFRKHPEPIFQINGSRFAFEDPHIWCESGRFRCLMKDMAGLPGSCPRATLLFESPDAIEWDTAQFQLVATPHLETPEGRVERVDRLERPACFHYREGLCLSFAVKPLGEAASYLVFAPNFLPTRS